MIVNNNINNNNNNVNNVNAFVDRDENLDIYIPRISASETEDSIREMFFHLYIGVVDYADIVATKNPETKEVQYYSAFIRLKHWGPSRYPMETFKNTKNFKIMLPRTGGVNCSFWLLLPNKNPLPRTKVNVHQLAAATDKLFEQLEDAEKQLVNKSEEIKELTACVSRQNDVIEELNFQLLSERENTNARFEEMMYLIKDLQSQLKYNTFVKKEEEPVNQVEIDETEETDIPVLTTNNLPDSVKEQDEPTIYYRQIIADEDDCIYSRPVRRETKYSLYKTSREEQMRCYEQQKIYRKNKVGEEERLTPPSFDDLVRASISRDFCGNN